MTTHDRPTLYELLTDFRDETRLWQAQMDQRIQSLERKEYARTKMAKLGLAVVAGLSSIVGAVVASLIGK